ncbi:MAG TPA: carboxypeptidase M32 [Bacteroidales bacterium]|nr:carboxypeptidase M32 [Bacteroidales bacterium]
MENYKDGFKRFLEIQEEMKNIGDAQGVLYWDMVTIMPSKGVERRSDVIGYLSQLMYKLETSDEYNNLVYSLYEHYEEMDDKEKAMVKAAKKSLDFMKKIPEEEYLEYSKLVASGENYWAKARENNDYESFKPILEKIVFFNKKIADYMGYEDTPYDALLDLYEPGATVKEIDGVFQELREGLLKLLDKINASDVKIDSSILKGEYEIEPQKKYNTELAKRLGYDFERGAIAESAHPFSTNFGNNDVRITTAYSKEDPIVAMYSTIHETGHAIYEQNIPDDITKTNIGGGVSMGIHESQSRYYENILARDREFIETEYPNMIKAFDGLKKYSPFEIYQAINKVEPSLIRIDADELTYSMHIIIRYELEKMMINGEVDFDELPKLWADKYTEYLGITPDSYAKGVLQDVHWSGGMIGYFPSYALGNLYGAQMLYKGILRDLPNYYELIREGKVSEITKWLAENVHSHGGTYEPKVLIEKITGEPLDAKYFLQYLNEKYSRIYDFK